MENNKFWIYLGLGVVAALSLKWFGSPESTAVSKRWSIQATMGEEIQYKRSAKTQDRITGLSNERRSTPLVQIKSGATTAAPAVAAKKEDVKAKNIAKKKDDKKKKKKKKKPRVLGVPETETDSDSDSDSDVASVPTSAGAAAPLAFAGAGQAGAPPTTAQLTDWENLLLVTPNHRETTRFINLFQTKQVSAEVFYGIVGQMLNDGRTQMRSLGVMALGATPSVTSYEMLVTTVETESGTVKSQASTYLERTYNRTQAVNILYGVLKKREVAPATQLQALKNLSALLTSTRKPGSINPETGETETPAKTENVNQQHVIQYFRLLQAEVIPSLTQSQDPEIRQLALNVSSLLIAAVNPAGVAPAQTALAAQ